jgi:hypothetical protein
VVSQNEKEFVYKEHGRICHHQELHGTDSNSKGFYRINIFEVVGVDVRGWW